MVLRRPAVQVNVVRLEAIWLDQGQLKELARVCPLVWLPLRLILFLIEKRS